MLYLVISTPYPDTAAGLSERQRDFWSWIAGLEAEGRVLHGWRRMGRGAVIIFDAPDHETLQGDLQQWAARIPAAFEVQPLIMPPDTPPRAPAAAPGQ